MADFERRRTFTTSSGTHEKARERRRSSISALAIPDAQFKMSASVNFGVDGIEFESSGVKISRDGLFIGEANVSAVHPEDLRILGDLGRGACSVVKQAQHLETRKLYAVKVFNVFDRDTRAQLLKEIEMLWEMECPSLIPFVGGYLENGHIHMVLEYMDRGNLGNIIHGWLDVEYGEDLMAAVTFQMLWGLGYLHYEYRLHRDVKPQNVLLNSKGEVKLSDFGIARELQGDTDLAQTMVGTIRYMSPERLAGGGYDSSADVWSLGVVLLEMATRRLPFDTVVSQIDLHDRLAQEKAFEDLLKLVPDCSTQLEEVLRGCLQARPEDRLRAEELLELEWFRPFRRSSQDFRGGNAPSLSPGNDGNVLEDPPGQPQEGGVSNDEIAEEHVSMDLDQAAHVVREYLSRALDIHPDSLGSLSTETPSGSGSQPRRLRGIGTSSQLIQTMYSDDESDHSGDA